MLKFQGKKLSLGYATGIGQLIKTNQEPAMHLLGLCLDDCAMKDEEFSVLLDSIVNS